VPIIVSIQSLTRAGSIDPGGSAQGERLDVAVALEQVAVKLVDGVERDVFQTTARRSR